MELSFTKAECRCVVKKKLQSPPKSSFKWENSQVIWYWSFTLAPDESYSAQLSSLPALLLPPHQLRN